MEIIIGREEGIRRLHVTADGKTLNLGSVGDVPLNVSRQHCRLTVQSNGAMSIQNLKDRNVTYVDGVAIDKAQITKDSRIELGPDRYSISVKDICSRLGISLAPVFSLAPLKPLWDEYDSGRLRIQTEGQKSANTQRLQGLISAMGMLCIFMEMLQVFRVACFVVSALLSIWFFIKGKNVTEMMVVKLHDYDEQFRNKYVCPNPSCGRSFGIVRYKDLINNYPNGCPTCHCRYTTE